MQKTLITADLLAINRVRTPHPRTNYILQIKPLLIPIQRQYFPSQSRARLGLQSMNSTSGETIQRSTNTRIISIW